MGDHFATFIFTIGPLLFLYIRALLKLKQKYNWLHFVWFGFYFLYHILYLVQPLDFKFNSVNSVYEYHLPMREVYLKVHPDPFLLRQYVNVLLGVHWFVYLMLSSILVYKQYKKVQFKIFALTKNEFSWPRNLLFHIWINFIIFVALS
jgi:hypothetical protein